MKAIIEIVRETLFNDGGCVQTSTKENISGITIRETKIFGFKILSKIDTSFVTEVRIFSLLIKRSRQKGWAIYRLPKAKP
jgi:hypothetical protein